MTFLVYLRTIFRKFWKKFWIFFSSGVSISTKLTMGNQNFAKFGFPLVNLVGIDTPLEKKNFQNFLKMVLRYTKNVKKKFFSIFVVFLQIWSQYLNFSWKRLENFSKNFENHHFLVQILKYMQKSDPLQPKPKKIQKNVLNQKCPQLPFGKSQKISEC